MASAVPATWALGELEQALVAQGAKVRRIANLSEATANEFCILAAAFESPLCRAFSGSKTLLRRRKRSRFASHKAKSIPAAYTAARFALQ